MLGVVPVCLCMCCFCHTKTREQQWEHIGVSPEFATLHWRPQSLERKTWVISNPSTLWWNTWKLFHLLCSFTETQRTLAKEKHKTEFCDKKNTKKIEVIVRKASARLKTSVVYKLKFFFQVSFNYKLMGQVKTQKRYFSQASIVWSQSPRFHDNRSVSRIIPSVCDAVTWHTVIWRPQKRKSLKRLVTSFRSASFALTSAKAGWDLNNWKEMKSTKTV